MRFTKKIISSALAVVLVVGMVPHAAFADDKTKREVIQDAAKEKIISILNIPKSPDKMLEKITEYGIELFFKHVIDVQFGTSYGTTESKEDKILNLLKEMKVQVDKIEKTTDQTYLRVKQAALEAPLNSFMKDLSKVKNQCNDLTDMFQKAVKISDADKRAEAIEDFKSKNLERLRNLAGSLNVLSDSMSQVIQGRGTYDIFQIYDQLVAESFNFANGVPFEQRMQFRQSVASTWVFGSLIVSVLDMGSTKGAFATQLNSIYSNGKKLNNLINKTRLLTADQVEKFNKDGSRAVYCYTTGGFLSLRDGNYFNGWKGALRADIKGEKFYNRSFDVGFYGDDDVKSPFGDLWKINAFSEERRIPFGSSQVTNDQIKAMLVKLPSGVTLYDEFINHGLNKKQDGSVIYKEDNLKKKGLLVGNEKFVHNGWNNVHTWSMDVFNMTDKQGASPTIGKTVLKACTFLLKKGRKNAVKRIKIEYITDPATLFVLSKVK